MTTSETTRPAKGKMIVLAVVAISLLAMLAGSLVYRFAHPELQKAMREQEVAQAPSGMDEAGGMPAGAMNMDAVREMLEALETRISENPKDLEALMQASNIYMMRQDKATALSYLDRAKAASNGDLETLMQLSKLYFDLGEFERTTESIGEILKADPNNMYAHFNMGVVLKYRLENLEEAEKHFKLVADGEHEFEDLRNAAKKELE
ncbi:MAG: hypothetical protein KKB70_04495 [Proteobacteria bacterium]|nr:hypothetical protein [Pseudomonadota bacterium]MBU1612195.1 hypothetical protein [Pseudomonadota bacterium]